MAPKAKSAAAFTQNPTKQTALGMDVASMSHDSRNESFNEAVRIMSLTDPYTAAGFNVLDSELAHAPGSSCNTSLVGM